ncbi:unnamed protein product [Cylindrotheca closterium]|uniref:Uncharacterized protein n=1 Tax=Cylindrotheca closterium TaxID=2856 RepID=A0AAD2FL58_9STRA|nr:unnamed protein product [Cylindrotheca closterium]
MADQLFHEAFKFMGNDSTEFPFGTAKRRYAPLDISSYKISTRYPEKGKFDSISLYCNAQLIVLFSQFTYRGENAYSEIKFIPTHCKLIDVLSDPNESSTDKAPLPYVLGHCGAEILEAECIDCTISGMNHFLKAWIVNPQNVIKRRHLKTTATPSTLQAAIIVAKPLRDYGGESHNPEKVAIKFQALMNRLDVYCNNTGGRAFNLKSIPLKILKDTSTAMMKV